MSNVILLGKRRAIVVDCGGAQAQILLRLLDHFRIESIARLIVSHNHDDHSRGAAAVLTAFCQQIEEVWLVEDSARARSLFWRRLSEEVREGHLSRDQIKRLEREKKPRVVFQDKNVSLITIAPDCLTNFRAVDDRDPNVTSAILMLKHGQHKIIFAGDSTIQEWEDVFQRMNRPLRCEILTVPHHAGGIWARRQPGETGPDTSRRISSELDWLYTNAVNAKYGVVSVGTNNSYRHPRPEVMEALKRADTIPICTQMTGQCTNDLEVQRLRSLPLALPSRSVLQEDVNEKSKSRNVPCASTILVEMREDEIVIQRFADHQAMITELHEAHSGTPMCRNRDENES